MKKTFIAAAASLACASAFSQVTLYGLADIGVTHVSGYAQGSVTQLSSGIMEGSRWGIKGEEDLGPWPCPAPDTGTGPRCWAPAGSGGIDRPA